MQRLLMSSAVVFAATACVMAADGVKSGLQVGDSAGAYNVKDITGPNQPQSLCYR